MGRARGRYRGLYLVPHGRGFKYLRAVPKDLRAVEGRTAWVKCLGAVSRLQAEILAHQLAALHGQRIADLRSRRGASGEFRLSVRASAADASWPTRMLSPMTLASRSVSSSADCDLHRPARACKSLACLGNVRLEDLLTLWQRVTAPRSRKTVAKTRRAVSRFVEFVGDPPAAEITRTDLIAFRNRLASQRRGQSQHGFRASF